MPQRDTEIEEIKRLDEAEAERLRAELQRLTESF